MADLTPAALTLATTQHGAITTGQLSRCGVSRHTVRRLELAGVVSSPFKSVRRVTGSRVTLELRCVELCLAHGDAYVTGPTAGMLLGLRKMPRHSPVVLATRHPLHLTHLGVRTRRSTKVGPFDTLRREDAIVTAHPVRLAFDLAADLSAHSHRSAVDQLIHEHGVTVTQLSAIADRLLHPNRPGSERFAQTLATLTNCPAESDAELVLAIALRERGVPVDSNERWLDLPNGSRARLDLSVADARWAVEVDVHPSHLGITGSTRDKQRDRQAHLIGWIVERVTSLDLENIAATADELAMLYARRLAELAA